MTKETYEVSQELLDGLRPFYNIYTSGGFANLAEYEKVSCEYMLNEYLRIISDLVSGKAKVI
jgi:hypothetical protein